MRRLIWNIAADTPLPKPHAPDCSPECGPPLRRAMVWTANRNGLQLGTLANTIDIGG